ncbi:hypothetical protein CKO38_14340 [Rhodospirillum rubrum]|uniref:tetratricopeptide repeat protein n=1 Tax=Rhodospirillum rubrum TaxID=1085 RepID=UPI0019064215|nr:tetratricopeptide repeat protein [Rhodospirillum rubrum]MBK1665698.1 hypothetical protein [Rhodospirillum rubrum]MBK1677826.1 hypothetical protein [Rhodospirillum rubrum]
MAKPPAETDPQQDALFREVEEDLRHERLAEIWKQYGGLIIAAAVVVVLAVAGVQGWRVYQADQRAEQAARFDAARDRLAKGDNAALEDLAALAADRSSGYAPLAALRRAAALADEGKTDEAIQGYRGLINDSAADPVFRDAARVLAVLHGLTLLDPAEIGGLLQPLRDGTGPWRPLAEELAAVSSLRQGDSKAAIEILRGILGDPQAPRGVRQRAGGLLAALGASPTPPAAGESSSSGPAPAAPPAGGGNGG